MLYAFGVGEAPISVSGDPRRAGQLVHTVRAVGAVTQAICAARRVATARACAARSGAPGRRPQAGGGRRLRGRRARPRAAAAGDLRRARRARALRPGDRPLRRARARAAALPRRARALGGARRPRARAHRRRRRLRAGAGGSGSSPALLERADLDPDATVVARLRPRGDDALLGRGRCSSSGSRLGASSSRWSATCAARSATAATASSAATFICRDGPVFAWDRVAGPLSVRELMSGRAPRSRSSPSGSSPPATAASSRCSTSSTSCWRSPTRSRSPTSSRRPRATVEGPYDLSLVEGSVTTPEDAERIREVRGGLAAPGHDRRLRDGGRDPGAAQLQLDSTASSTPCTRAPSTSRRSRPRPRSATTSRSTSSSRAARSTGASCSRWSAPSSPGASRGSSSQSVCVECKQRGNVCVMVAHGTPCLGPVTHAGCGAICPAYDRGCYGCFGPKETPNTALAERLVGAARRARRRSDRRLPPDQQPAADGVPRREHRRGSEASRCAEPGPRRPRSRSGRWPGSRARARCTSGCATGEVEDVRLEIFEPPRFFEALLRGRPLRRGPRHHLADLRHLPDRLPAQRLRGDRGRARDRGRRGRSRRCAG